MSKPAPERVDPRSYNAFVRGVELRAVTLTSAAVSATRERPKVGSTKVTFGADIILESSDAQGFTALATITASFSETGAERGSIAATFRLTYTSDEAMTDTLWRDFGPRNVRANVWPYAREFIQSMTQRMGWPSFVLPVSTSARFAKPSVPPRPP